MADKLKRMIGDGALSVATAHPAASANVTSAGINLGHTSAEGLPPENIDVEISIPAMAAHSDNSKTILYDLHDSADNSSFAEVAPLHEAKLVGVTTTGTPATIYRFKLPPNVRQYIAVKCTNPAAGPAVTGINFTVSLKF